MLQIFSLIVLIEGVAGGARGLAHPQHTHDPPPYSGFDSAPQQGEGRIGSKESER